MLISRDEVLFRETGRARTKGYGPIVQVLRRRRQTAKRRGIEWRITDQEAYSLMSSDCFYCGLSPSQLAKHSRGTITQYYNGIDRQDNNIGYVLSNCVPCCKHCNRAKSDLPINEFYSWISRLKQYDRT